jgi:hypothetical protein
MLPLNPLGALYLNFRRKSRIAIGATSATRDLVYPIRSLELEIYVFFPIVTDIRVAGAEKERN